MSSSTDYHIRPADEEDCEWLAPRLREADLQEIKASCGKPVLEALKASLACSQETFVAENEDGPFCIFGVAPNPNDVLYGFVWMVGTPEIRCYAKSLTREARKQFALWHKRYPILTNWTDCRNTVAHEWLRALGCTFVNKLPFGVEQLPFLEFIHI